MRVQDLAASVNGTHEGEGQHEIYRVAPLEDAGSSDLSFVANDRAGKLAAASAAGCLLVPEHFDNAAGRTIVRVRDPRAAVARAVALLYPKTGPEPGVHPTAVLARDVQIGEGTAIGAGCVIGDRVRIGARCTLHAHVTLYHDLTIGDDVVLHSGCVIGADGFGFVLTGDHYEKFPQVGTVVLGNRVEIGANSCVDRAALGVTVIGEGTKLDNMVHVGHNCRIGKHVVIAAQTGLSGGVVIEDYAVIGGQVGIGDKARIESRAVLGSGSGVLTSKIVRAGQVMWGTPARPLKEYLAQLATLSRLAKKRRD